MSLLNLSALYDSAKAALAVHDFAAFREVQLKISDAMYDVGDESAWILQLEWKGFRVGDKSQGRKFKAQKLATTVEKLADHKRDTLVFDVPIPRGLICNETHSPINSREYQKELTRCLKIKASVAARENMNRVRFAGFPPFGLRFLGLNPNNIGQWRFSWVNVRAEGNESRRSRAESQRKIFRHTEDVVNGGYLSLFYSMPTRFRWRDAFQNFEAYVLAEDTRTIFDEVAV